MDKILLLIGAISLIGFIIWWFFGKSSNKQTVAVATSADHQEVEVLVNGGYTPNTVVLQQGTPATIVFERKDPSGCFNEVVFPDFGIHETLPVRKKHAVNIDTATKGEFRYSCGMNMFHGKVIIK